MAQRPRLLVASSSPGRLLEVFHRDSRFLMLPPCESSLPGVETAMQSQPDVVLLDLDSGSSDLCDLIEYVSSVAPYATVVVLSPVKAPETLAGFMAAGANGFQESPCDLGVLASYTKSVHDRVCQRKRIWVQERLALIDPRRPQLVAVFSPKGGVGKTTLSTNLAVALGDLKGQPGLLLDLDVEAGDAAVMLDLQPGRTLLEFSRVLEEGGQESISPYLTQHRSGLQLLAAPPGPEHAELIKPQHVTEAIRGAKGIANLVVADTAPAFSEQVLAVLDAADLILLLLTPDVTALKNACTALEIFADLRRADKVQIVMNRCNQQYGLSAAEVQRVTGRPVMAQIPDDVPGIMASVNEGIPIVRRRPDSPAARGIVELARKVIARSAGSVLEPEGGQPPGLWERLFPRR